MENQELGIEVLKKDMLVVAKISGTIEDALEDSRISPIEGVLIAKDALGFFGVIKNWSKAQAELKNLSDQERVTLVNHFQTNFDLENDTAEYIVETVVEIMLGFVKLSEKKEVLQEQAA